MVGAIDVILGFDPGGKTGRKFGWCICRIGRGQLRVYKADRATNTEDALKQVSSELPRNARVIASGIDAPMFWTDIGERKVDSIIRDAGKDAEGKDKKCPNSEHHSTSVKWCPFPLNVQEINSLWGACLAQGLLLGRLLHGCPRFDAPITEAHPKALLCLLGKCRPGLSELVQEIEKIQCPVCRPDLNQPVQESKNAPMPR